MLSHHRIETGPGVDVAAQERGAAVGVLLHEHRGDVLVGEAGGKQRANREDVRVGAAYHRYLLALEVLDLVYLAVLAVTSAVHSGRE